MSEYAEFPSFLSLYHEELLISVQTHTHEDPSSATKNLPIQPVIDKAPEKNGDQERPTSEPKTEPPEREHRKIIPSRIYNPEPILPVLQLKLTHGFQVKIITCNHRGNHWTGPTA